MDKLTIMEDLATVSMLNQDAAEHAEHFVGDHCNNWNVGENRDYLDHMFECTLIHGDFIGEGPLTEFIEWFKSHKKSNESMYIIVQNDPARFSLRSRRS